MLDSKAKDSCRICARELCGNQRRWIFHPTAKLSLQVLLSHALGRELSRDGRREFACSKCTFMLDRMYRFDTVIARVEALSIERMQKLLLEKDRLRQCISGLYRKNNLDELDSGMVKAATDAPVVETPALSDAKYSSLLEDDLTYSVYESWAEHDSQHHQATQHHQCQVWSEGSSQRSRKCRGCAILRVADSDYEAVCKVPRKVGRSTSCGPSTRCSASSLGNTEETCPGSEPDPQSSSLTEISQTVHTGEEENISLSPATSVESLDTAVDISQPCSTVHADLIQGQVEEEKVMSETEQSPKTGLELALSLVKSFECHPVHVPQGSRLPVPIKRLQQGQECPFSQVPLSVQQELQLDLAEMEELWMDDYMPCGPLGLQEKLIGEQQTQLVQYENAAGQCVTELQKSQQQVQALQTKIRESEANNKKLQQRLADMDCELRSVREAAQGQERAIQTLSSSLNIKESEVADLEQLFSEQKELLISLKQQNLQDELQQLQFTGAASGQLHAELLELQTSLFSTQLELQSIQRAQRQAQRREDDLLRTNQRLLTDFHGETRLRQEAEKHNQDLVAALQRARSDLENMQEKWKEAVEEKNRVVEEREGRITALKTSLQHKERLLHDYAELLDEKKEAGGNRDVLIHKLKLRIQDRDRALEHAMDERFACVERKEAEVRKLQLLLREKERDLQKLYGVLSNNEETITSLELLVRGKSLELEQVNEAWKGSQRIQDERETRLACSLTERDTLISQLQTVLHTCAKETEELTSALVSKVPFGSRKIVEELKGRLKLREQLFQKLLAEHNRQAQEHHAYVQELLSIGLSREQYIKDSAEHMVQVVAEQTARLQELRRQVVSEQKRSQNTSELSEDAQYFQEELQLVLSKEREAQRELSILRSTLASNQEQLQAQALQLNHKLQIRVACPASMEHVDISQADTGDSASGEEEDGDSEFADSAEEEEHCSATQQTLQSYEKHGGTILCPNPGSLEDQGLPEVRLLVEQKQAVERELWELKAQLEKAGFSSLSQMRKALFSLRSENEELKNSLKSRQSEFRLLYDDVEKRPGEDLSMPRVKHSTGAQSEPKGKQECIRPLSLDLGALQSCTTQLDLEQGKQQSQGLQTQTSPAKRFRELHTETSVQQDSKQVQVDLQDLGYETCGRSENELEREETSSPEFDDLELCTALSCRDGASQWWSGAGPVNRAGGDVASLQQQVEDLQMQLSRSQALIHSCQACVKDSTPRKVDRADRELQELMTRVSSLEEQLRKGNGHDEKEEKSSTWPGKFDALIQGQARELSHLRQRMREGRSACHILTQHLGDTTKAFEELLRGNDIDYYMGQCFRDQLAQSSALAQRVGAKISSRDYSEVPDDKTGHELLAIRLSKELQQKDKMIESLRSKLEQQQQARPDTPASNHALSEASDQSEHASFTIDEQASTNEDLDLGSELDTGSSFGQEEATERSIADSHCNPSDAVIQPSNPPSLTSSHGHQSSSSCPSMHCTPQMRIEGYAPTGFAGPQFKPLSGFHLGSSPQNDLSDLHLRSQHAFQQSALASLHGSPALKGTEPFENRTLWNMANGAPPRREGVYGDVSSCSSSYQSAAHQTGPDLMEEHLREIRSLRQRLEDSIQTNDRLRQQLEDRLGTMNKDSGAPTNIYIQGLDSVSKLSNEVQLLKEEKRTLQTQLQQAKRDGLKEVEHLQEAAVLERSRVKQAELEAEKWAGQVRQLQVQTGELKQDKQISQEKANRLQHEVNILQQQLSESRRLVNLLQCELQAYQSVCGAAKSRNTGADLQEPQSHMCLLEQQLHDRLDHNMALTSTRKKLFQDSSHSPPVRDTGFFNQASSNFTEPDNIQSSVKNLQEGEIPDGSYACRTGSHVVGRWDDFSILQQQLQEGKLIIYKMEAALQSSVEINLHEGCIKNILFSTKKLKQILEDVGSVLRMFWRSALPSVKAQTQQLQKEQSLQEEVVSLRNKLSQQEQTLRDTVETLRGSNRTKDSMEQYIFNQLSRTRDVLKKARTNLEVKPQALMGEVS